MYLRKGFLEYIQKHKTHSMTLYRFHLLHAWMQMSLLSPTAFGFEKFKRTSCKYLSDWGVFHLAVSIQIYFIYILAHEWISSRGWIPTSCGLCVHDNIYERSAHRKLMDELFGITWSLISVLNYYRDYSTNGLVELQKRLFLDYSVWIYSTWPVVDLMNGNAVDGGEKLVVATTKCYQLNCCEFSLDVFI